MRRKTLILTLAAILVAIVLYSAFKLIFDQNKPSQGLRDARINWEKIKTARNFYDLFEPIEEIKLADNMVSEINQLIIRPDKKIIVRERKEVKLFESDGRFIKVIGRNGQGPAEYLKPNYVAIDESLNIYILDTKSRRVNVFDSFGQQKRFLNLDKIVDEMAISNSRLYFYSSVNMYFNDMACCYENSSGKKLFDFAVPTSYLKAYTSNKIPPPMGVGEYMRVYKERMYIAHPLEYTIREFSPEGKELRQIEGKSSLFTRSDPAKKFSGGVTPAEFFGSFIKSILIANDLLIVFFLPTLNSKEIYSDIFTLDGKQINDESIIFKEHNRTMVRFLLAVASNGYFYSYYQPEPESLLEVANPVLIKYKFLPYKVN
jgi:hypothetical protein